MRRSDCGFSLIEIAIVMVVIGVIIASVAIGKNTMQSAETLKAYKKVVVTCVAAVSDAIRNGSVTPTPEYPRDISLEGGDPLKCSFGTRGNVINRVKIENATKDLKDLIKKNLHDGIDVNVVDNEITLYVPGS